MPVSRWSATTSFEPSLPGYKYSNLHIHSNFSLKTSSLLLHLLQKIPLLHNSHTAYNPNSLFLWSSMEKTSKTVPQKEAAFSSRPVSGEYAAEPHLKEFILVGCSTVIDFKVEKPSSIPGRCKPISRYQCTITEKILDKVKLECNWGKKHVVVPSPEESITTHVEGFLSVYTYPFTLGPLNPIIVTFCKRYDPVIGQIHPCFGE